MSEHYRDHIVEFDKYCKNCEFRDYPESALPCHNCLNEPVNTDSKKPIEFKPSKEFLQKEKIRKEKERLQSKSRLKQIK